MYDQITDDLSKMFTGSLEDNQSKLLEIISKFTLQLTSDQILALMNLSQYIDLCRQSGLEERAKNFENQMELYIKYKHHNGSDAYVMKSVEFQSLKQYIDKIYAEAQRIVSLKDDERFEQLIPEWKLTFNHIDVFKQKHYDGKAKMGTSLKWIQFSMRYHNIEEMPISHDEYITKDQIPEILSYNWNDVDSTEDFFKKIYFETELRETLSEKYQLNLLNASEPRLAKEIFAKFLSEEMHIPKYQLKQLKTQRDSIAVKDIIFPYIGFESPELLNALKTLNKWIIYPNSKSKMEHCFKYGGIETILALGGTILSIIFRVSAI